MDFDPEVLEEADAEKEKKLKHTEHVKCAELYFCTVHCSPLTQTAKPMNSAQQNANKVKVATIATYCDEV